MRKDILYASLQDITPPLLFRYFKKTKFYSFLKQKFHSLNSSDHTEIVVIETGPLKGLRLKFNPEGQWQKQMMSGEYDNEILKVVTSLPLENKVIYDVGAHVGIHSLLFSRLVGTGGFVYGFEPNSANAERFKEIVELNPEVANAIEVHQLALGNEIGETEFLSNSDLEGGTSTGGFITNASTIWKREVYLEQTGFTPTVVKLETIDNLIDTLKIKPPALIKIDVEGAEQLVLEGAIQTLNKYKPVIIIELHSIFSAYQCMEILKGNKYTTKLLEKESDGRVIIEARAESQF